MGARKTSMRLNLVAIALIVALSVAWAETNGNAAVLKLDLGGGDQPGSTMKKEDGSPKKLEEGVTCIGGIPKDCYSETTVPAGNSKCAKTEGVQLTVKKVTVYAVDPKKCKGLPAGFGNAKLELKNVQCECRKIGKCYNTKQVRNKQTNKMEDKKVMVQIDSASIATIGGKKGSLDSKFKYDCYVAVLQQVMDRKELIASADEQKKAFTR